MLGRQWWRAVRAALAGLILALAGSVAADVYRWKDEDGEVHFTDEPPPGKDDDAESVETGDVNTADPVPDVDYPEEREPRKVREVILRRTRQGHFVAPGKINGTSVTFLVDTGASHVSVPQSVAERIGLSRGEKVRVGTADGMSSAYLTKLDEVAIEGIEARDIQGSINPNVDYEVVLLGMSFLQHVDFTQRNGQMILRQTGDR
jgi:clan AA aspartic protease (TIGR02281 family)